MEFEQKKKPTEKTRKPKTVMRLEMNPAKKRRTQGINGRVINYFFFFFGLQKKHKKRRTSFKNESKYPNLLQYSNFTYVHTHSSSFSETKQPVNIKTTN